MRVRIHRERLQEEERRERLAFEQERRRMARIRWEREHPEEVERERQEFEARSERERIDRESLLREREERERRRMEQERLRIAEQQRRELWSRLAMEADSFIRTRRMFNTAQPTQYFCQVSQIEQIVPRFGEWRALLEEYEGTLFAFSMHRQSVRVIH